MTKEQRNTSERNKRKAQKFFGIYKKHSGMDLHHINPDWKENDIERYIQWNPEDLVLMTHSEHARLHAKQRAADPEWREKVSKANKGKHNLKGENNPNYGKKHPGVGGKKKGSPPTKGSKGMHWFNNGETQVLIYECPEGFIKGRIKGFNPNRNSKGQYCSANTEVISEIAQGSETP